jgi:acyl dehydratase
MTGLYCEDFKVGTVFRHDLRRTVTQADNVVFSTMTHNPSPLHLDAEFMRKSEFGQPLINSCFTFGLMIGISVADTTMGTAIANLGYDEARFPKPVFAGDTLRVETEVTDIRDSKSRPTTGIVTLMHRTYNQKDELVASCTRTVLVKKKRADGRP